MESENSKIYRDLYEKPLQRHLMARIVFPVRILLISNGHRRPPFLGIILEISSLPDFYFVFLFLIDYLSNVYYDRVYEKLIT